LTLDQLAPDFEQAAVAHARGAGGLAVAAGEAAIQVPARGGARRAALEHLLHEVDAPARPVELVAEQLVGRTGGVAEPAVHAGTQDGVRLPTGLGIANVVGE